ncbi:LCP family protein [uncultured Clostridium sp.]|uniref:LCP family protein n=1 Tax=uncultured Clostridium sp. TaxID=59620 RepID=UPI0025839F09|nr:LCP family protein [uncultured Clostridium sp.]
MKNNREKNPKKRKILISSISIILAVILVIVAGVYIYINKALNKVESVEVNTDNIGLNTETKEEFKEIRNIALLGIDSIDDDLVGRSDSIMILTLDNIHNKIKLTSIMRDSYVNIYGYGMDKINHAYAYGGAELALKTLNENFDLNISEVMVVNFTSLVNIIDKIGGVNIDITEEEIPHISGITSPGEQLLNGSQALTYSRIRYATGGDYKRTERQRTVINAIFNKLKDTPLTKYPELVNEFLPYVKTNISSNDLLSLGKEFSGLAMKGLEQDRFPRDEQGVGQMINGVYYLTFDLEEVKNSIRDYIFNDK